MILLIIFAFDPLAVVLTIGANIVILQRKKPDMRTEDRPAPTELVYAEFDYDEIINRIVIPPAAEIDYDELAKRVNIPEQLDRIVEIAIPVTHQVRDPRIPGRVKLNEDS